MWRISSFIHLLSPNLQVLGLSSNILWTGVKRNQEFREKVEAKISTRMRDETQETYGGMLEEWEVGIRWCVLVLAAAAQKTEMTVINRMTGKLSSSIQVVHHLRPGSSGYGICACISTQKNCINILIYISCCSVLLEVAGSALAFP